MAGSKQEPRTTVIDLLGDGKLVGAKLQLSNHPERDTRTQYVCERLDLVRGGSLDVSSTSEGTLSMLARLSDESAAYLPLNEHLKDYRIPSQVQTSQHKPSIDT